MPSIWIERLRISQRVAEKIADQHHIQPQEVRAAVERVEGLNFSWDHDPERGLRAIIDVQIQDENALVVVYPTENPMDHEWRLGSAYLIHG